MESASATRMATSTLAAAKLDVSRSRPTPSITVSYLCGSIRVGEPPVGTPAGRLRLRLPDSPPRSPPRRPRDIAPSPVAFRSPL
eukprot:scaffold250781_cov32-Tisochrysis_lutea.AAC.3